MSLLEHIRLMSQYNQWMNDKLYQASSALSDEKLITPKGAFFGSILGTLNHIVVGDIVWLKRFSTHPANYSVLDEIRKTPQPTSLDQILFRQFSDLVAERKKLDGTIISWCDQLAESDLNHSLPYRNMKGQPAVKVFGSLILHFFNHQTHHRGQATTLLSQEGIDVGVTDLLALISNEAKIS